MTEDDEGRPAPKQFCRFGRDRSLLAQALDRAERLTTPDRIVPVVAREHVRWWLPALEKYPTEHCLAQPLNRGTAAAILAALCHIRRWEEESLIAILPSDHAVEDETVLAAAFRSALGSVARNPDLVVLLGMSPDGPEEEYGWIEPLPTPAIEPRPVAAFVEKPLPKVAAELMRRGALWNSFLIATTTHCLLDLFRITQPDLFRAFDRHPMEPGRLPGIYAALPALDFSRHVLQAVPGRLRVIRVPPCGWIDLGSPARVRRFQQPDSIVHRGASRGRRTDSDRGLLGKEERDGRDVQLSVSAG
jgi:mannose-1-phosphate guanylyltransferase